MASHSSALAWKIPWTEEPGRLQSMGPLRVGQDWMTSLSLFTFLQWRRKWPPTPVFFPGESQGRWSLVGCSLWGHTESDMTEVTQQQQLLYRILLSVKPQHESATGVHMSPPFWTSLPSPSPSHSSRLTQSPCLSFLSHRANSRWPCILHTVM